jgi:hypothetical protein
MANCAHCHDEVGKRDILCKQHWKDLANVRKVAIRMAPYRRDEVGKKFLNELLTCDETVLREMIANNAVKLEQYAKKSNDRSFKDIVTRDINKAKEEMEIV